MNSKTIHLGFEVPSGEPVSIPIAHMCVTGQTQAAGKTTTLEALVDRSGLKAIAFVTKRGEGAFKFNHLEFGRKNVLIDPYFRHRADWQFVSDILGAILSEKLKFQRPWIMQVCRSAKTLDDVRTNVVTRLYGNKQKKIKPATGLANSVYTELEEYLNLLMPELARLPYTDKLELETGLNVMDLSAYSTPLQMLVVSSVLEWIYKHETDVITVVPEAWEFVPQGRNSPAKSAAIALIRKGGALRNFIWLDSQDLASVDTEIRRACGVWVLGVQREQNEVKRVLNHIPAGTKRPKVEDIMHLERGQFFVCHGREIRKVYVQPKWMTKERAYGIAVGELPMQESPVMPPEFAKTVAKGAAAKVLNDEFEKNLELISSGDMIAEPYNTPKPEDYGTIPAGLPYKVDDGGQYPRPWIPDSEATKETDDMDQQERERYEGEIKQWKHRLYYVERRIPDSYASSHSYEEWAYDSYKSDLDSECVKAEGGESSPVIETAISHSAVAHEIMKDAFFVDKIVREVVGRIPASSTIKVEPREVVLKRFQQEEVARTLELIEARSVWQKSVMALLEAKGAPMQKAAIVIAITGRKTVNMQRDFKVQYEEIDELANMGFVRKDPKNGIYPNLSDGIRRRLEVFEPTDADIADIVGQVMLKLKG